MTSYEIKNKLKEIAPNIVFTVNTTPDHHYRWDGEGKDPVEDGYIPHHVQVCATVIVGGVFFTKSSVMSGHYINNDKPDYDIGGYLPQMLHESASQLSEKFPEHIELKNAVEFLEKEMKDRYEEQQK